MAKVFPMKPPVLAAAKGEQPQAQEAKGACEQEGDMELHTHNPPKLAQNRRINALTLHPS